MYQAFRRGMQSVADDVAAKGYANNLRESKVAEMMHNSNRQTAEDLAAVYPRIQQEANQFANEFLSGVKAIPEQNIFDGTASFAGRKVAQAGDLLMNPAAQMGLFAAPMVLPMVMGGSEQEQIPPEVAAEMQRRQMMQQRGYQ